MLYEAEVVQSHPPEHLKQRSLDGKNAACVDEDWQPANKFFSSIDDADAQCSDAHLKANIAADNVVCPSFCIFILSFSSSHNALYQDIGCLGAEA